MKQKRTVELSLEEYQELIELKARVNSAIIFLDTDEYADRNVLYGILIGVPVKKTKEASREE